MTYHILDKRFCYTPACSTDITKTFERARACIAQQEMQKTLRHIPAMYFPIPETTDEIEIAEAYKLMHQDIDTDYPWGN